MYSGSPHTGPSVQQVLINSFYMVGETKLGPSSPQLIEMEALLVTPVSYPNAPPYITTISHSNTPPHSRLLWSCSTVTSPTRISVATRLRPWGSCQTRGWRISCYSWHRWEDLASLPAVYTACRVGVQLVPWNCKAMHPLKKFQYWIKNTRKFGGRV